MGFLPVTSISIHTIYVDPGQRLKNAAVVSLEQYEIDYSQDSIHCLNSSKLHFEAGEVSLQE